MKVSIDRAGRLVVPKVLRDQLGLRAGSTLDISEYGGGLFLEPAGGGAHLEHRDGRLVAVPSEDMVVTDEEMYAIRDAIRR